MVLLHKHSYQQTFSTLRFKKIEQVSHFGEILKCIYVWKRISWLSLKLHWSMFPGVKTAIENQCNGSGIGLVLNSTKPIPEPVMHSSLPVHACTCIIRIEWVKECQTLAICTTELWEMAISVCTGTCGKGQVKRCHYQYARLCNPLDRFCLQSDLIWYQIRADISSDKIIWHLQVLSFQSSDPLKTVSRSLDVMGGVKLPLLWQQ